jgi:hypothetical protein
MNGEIDTLLTPLDVRADTLLLRGSTAKSAVLPQRTPSMPGIELRTLLLVALLPLTGCVLSRPTGGKGGMRDIQLDEIRPAREDNVLDLIERIRPSWVYFHDLRDPEDPQETAGPLVMINDLPPHPLFTLQYFPLDNVQEIRYLTASYALHRYRVNSPAGVILVVTRLLVGPEAEVKPDTGRASLAATADSLMEVFRSVTSFPNPRTLPCNSPSRSTP